MATKWQMKIYLQFKMADSRMKEVASQIQTAR